jgi:hypothetical protein
MKIYILLISLSFITLPIIAGNIDAKKELKKFIVGNYLLVGKAVDSQETYTGKLSIQLKNDQLFIKRHINDEVTFGQAKIKTANNGHTNLLEMNFTLLKVNYQQTCLIQGDLDNYARISCYLYPLAYSTSDPGLEVLFHDHTQLN